MKIASLAVALAVAAFPVLTHAQAEPATQGVKADEQIILKQVMTDKRSVYAQNLQLTDAEGTAFWPVYEAYQKDLQQLNQRIGAMVMAYANAYNKGPVANDVAKTLLDEALAVDDAEAKLKASYAPKVLGALPATKAARYIQIENKIRAAIRYELAAGIPLVE